MEQNQELPDLKRILKRRKWWLILPSVFAVVTTAFIALLLPNVYRSTATIHIQSQQIPQDLVPSTVTSFVEQRIQAITQEVKSRTKILHLVEKYDLLPDKRKRLTTEDLVDKDPGADHHRAHQCGNQQGEPESVAAHDRLHPFL